MIRAFLGIAVPEAQRAALAIQQFLLPLPRKVEPAQMHLTLVFLGEVPDAVLEAAHEAFQRLQVDAFPLALQGLGLFGGDRPRAAWAGVAPSEPLKRLQSKAERAAAEAGCKVEARRFVPHVTLGRFPPPPFPETARLERAIADGSAFRTDPWQVTEIVLWQSRLGHGTAHYEVLAEYPLS